MGYKYKKGFPEVWSLPIFTNEKPMILSKLGEGYKMLDIGCGMGKIYNEYIKPSGINIEYIGLDTDTSLKGKVNFPIFSSVEELEAAGYPHRYFDGLMMLNLIEHIPLDELYNTLSRVNPYIDGDIFILTANPFCLDYLHNDPEHVAFYTHDVIFGLLKHLDFTFIEIWRGKGVHRMRQLVAKSDPSKKQMALELNELQIKVCKALGLDWFGNLFVVGDRREIEEKESPPT